VSEIDRAGYDPILTWEPKVVVPRHRAEVGMYESNGLGNYSWGHSWAGTRVCGGNEGRNLLPFKYSAIPRKAHVCFIQYNDARFSFCL